MAQEVKVEVGDDLLDFIVELGDILDGLAKAASYGKTITENLEYAYKGKASDELTLYYSSMNAHINRMYSFYYKASQYISNTYQTMYMTDEQLGNWLEKNIQ